jgi:plasmid stability protein
MVSSCNRYYRWVMANITLKNIPEHLYKQLKESAQLNRRSINSEAIVCLEKALQHIAVDEERLMERIRALRNQFPVHMSEKARRQAVEEGRA